MLIKNHKGRILRLGIIAIITLLISSGGGPIYAARIKNNLIPSDSTNYVRGASVVQQVADAAKVLESVGMFEPIEDKDSNIIEMAHDIVDDAASDIQIKVLDSENLNVDQNGTISFGSNASSGYVTLLLSKGKVSSAVSIAVSVTISVAPTDEFDRQIEPLVEPVTPIEEPIIEPIVDPVVEPVPDPIEVGSDPNKAPAATPINIAEIIGIRAPATGDVSVSTITDNAQYSGTVTWSPEDTSFAQGTVYTANILIIPKTGYTLDGVECDFFTVTGAESSNLACSGIVTAVFPATKSFPVYLNVLDYGAKGDGSTDNTAAFQNAADAAKLANMTLLIPAGDYLIDKSVTLYTSVECQGRIIIPNAVVPTLTIGRSVAGTRLSPSLLSSLTRGSERINGLQGYEGGTLILSSTEELIKRDNPSETFYTKNEAATIADTCGGIYPALDCSYDDLSKLTATVYPYEQPITVNGLWVDSFGNSVASGNTAMVKCNRSNVTFNDLKIKNESSVDSPYYGMLVFGCTNTVLNNPQIENIPNDYGIALNICASTVINDGNITGCGHAIAGRHSKEAQINGGYYSKVIDCHWGSDYVIDGATINDSIWYAGTNITIQNCRFINAQALLMVRYDTPELMGQVIVDNVSIQTSEPWILHGVGYADWANYIDFGRLLNTPDNISVTDIVVDIPSTCTFTVIKLPTVLENNNEVAPVGIINSDNIKTVAGTGKIAYGY